MESTNPEPGVFRYTFQQGDAPYLFGFANNYGFIQVYFPGPVEVQDAAGWHHEMHSSGRILLSATNGLTFVEEPMTLSVRSCLTAVKTYSGNAPNDLLGPYAGVFAPLYYRDHTPSTAVGYRAFEYIAPALPMLTVEQDGTNVLLHGSSVSPGFVLETSNAFSLQPEWTPLPDALSVTNFEFIVRLPDSPQSRFFRLRHPCLE